MKKQPSEYFCADIVIALDGYDEFVVNREVNYFVFAEGKRRRLYLVNTDWTTPGNVKKVRMKWAGQTARVEVKEGLVASLLLE